MPGTITVASSGTLQASTGKITVSNNGNWSNSGVFDYGSSTVEFTGTSHTISGDSAFYKLDCQITAGIITFEADKTQTIHNSLTLKGGAGTSNYLSLRSSSGGTQWKISPPLTRDVDYVNLKDCNNITNSSITISSWTDSGNNSYWSTTPSGGGGDSGGGGGGGGGTSYITVSSISPSSGAAGVAVNTAISTTFSDTMNGSTLTTDTFKVTGGGSTVSGSVSTNGNKATFTPASNLAYNTTYSVTITTGAQAANAAGSSLSSAYSWSFTTASAPPTPTPQPTPSPTPSPSATPAGSLSLSKEAAYLSGDTIVVTVTDGDRDTDATSSDTLKTAIKVAATNYYSGDLFLDLKEDGVNSGTFLATIKTGTATTGGASSGARSNVGFIKTQQGGSATVAYADIAPYSTTSTKALSFSSFDATVKFDAESYILNSYATATHVDAEENKDSTKVDTLLDHAYIETSSVNRSMFRFVETGVDTGTFKGSILISSKGTLDYEQIQASNGDTLKVWCEDDVNTTGAPRVVNDLAQVTGAVTPAPTPTAGTPAPSPTPTPAECEATKMTISSRRLTLRVKANASTVSVTVSGDNDCPVEGERVKSAVNAEGREYISITSRATTNDKGVAAFTIKVKKTGVAKVTFKAGNLKGTMMVEVRKKKNKGGRVD